MSWPKSLLGRDVKWVWVFNFYVGIEIRFIIIESSEIVKRKLCPSPSFKFDGITIVKNCYTILESFDSSNCESKTMCSPSKCAGRFIIILDSL